MVNFGPLAAEIYPVVWGTLQISTGFAAFASWQPYCTALEYWALATLCGVAYIRQGGHHVGHWPTFLVKH